MPREVYYLIRENGEGSFSYLREVTEEFHRLATRGIAPSPDLERGPPHAYPSYQDAWADWQLMLHMGMLGWEINGPNRLDDDATASPA